MPFEMLKRTLAIILAGCMINIGVPRTAYAAVIDTPTLLQVQERAAAISRIQAQLSRDEVRKVMIELGVDPAQAQARVSALTDSEVAKLDRELAQLPAGGDAWLLLVIVLTVLVVLFATGKLKYY